MKEEQKKLTETEVTAVGESVALFGSFPAAFLHWREHGGKLFESLPAASPSGATGLCWIVAGTEYAANRALLKARNLTFVRRVQRAEAHAKVAAIAEKLKNEEQAENST